jgi:hypothetical protein
MSSAFEFNESDNDLAEILQNPGRPWVIVEGLRRYMVLPSPPPDRPSCTARSWMWATTFFGRLCCCRRRPADGSSQQPMPLNTMTY